MLVLRGHYYYLKGEKKEGGQNRVVNRRYKCKPYFLENASTVRFYRLRTKFKTQNGKGKTPTIEKAKSESRTALLLRTEMSILRDAKMRPLFKEAIVTKLAVTQSTRRRYQ